MAWWQLVFAGKAHPHDDQGKEMIRQIIFEMNETLVEVRASAARTIADQKEMRRHIAKLESLQDSWKEKAELALSKDREDLARAALVEKKKAADMADIDTQITVFDHDCRVRFSGEAWLEGMLTTLLVVYAPGSVTGKPEDGEKVVVAVLGLAHCNGIMKLLTED